MMLIRIATFVVNIEPFIRTNNKKEQIKRLRMEISRKTTLIVCTEGRPGAYSVLSESNPFHTKWLKSG